ncbi:MAG: serine/threonine-protein kinase [Planctomycetota bacterium]
MTVDRPFASASAELSNDDACSSPLDELLAACLREAPERQAGALEDACREAPQFASDLRERFRILSGLGFAAFVADTSSLNVEPAAPRAFGDFELFEVIGRGGMGVVHRARQVSLDREVVVKLIRPELLNFEGTRQRFVREAEAIAQLRHPGIVPIYVFGETQGVPYFALEYVDGCSLAKRLADVEGQPLRGLRGSALSAGLAGRSWTGAALEVGRQIAAALHHAHQRGILHRDVKPSNVLLGVDGRARVIDFGLHALLDDEATDAPATRLTRAGVAPGTLLYMAPEQLEEGTYDVRSEVYALGATLYELLTRAPPFQGSNRSTTERLIRAGAPRPLRAIAPAVPRDVEAVVLRALSLDPTRRYVDMRAFEDDLERARDGRPVAARPDSAWYRLRRWIGRQPTLAALTFAVTALVVAAPTVVIVQQRDHARALRAAYDEERAARLAAEDLSSFVVDVLEAADPNKAEPNEAVQQILERGVERLEARLAVLPTQRAELQRILGRIHGSLGLFDVSQALLERSLETLEQHRSELVAAGADEAQRRQALARVVDSRAALALVLETRGARVAAFGQRRLLADELAQLWTPESWAAKHARANWMRMVAEMPDEAFPNGDRPTEDEVLSALRSAADFLKADFDDEAARLGPALGWLGSHLLNRVRGLRGPERAAALTECRAVLERALDVFGRASASGSLDAADTQIALGLTLKFQGEFPRAEALYRAAIETYTQRLPPKNYRIGASLVNLAALIEAQGRPRDAARELERAREILDEALSPEHPFAVVCLGNLAGARYRGHEHEGLIELYDEVLRRQTATLPPNHPHLAASHEARGVLKVEAGDVDGGRADLERARAEYAGAAPLNESAVARVDAALAALPSIGG